MTKFVFFIYFALSTWRDGRVVECTGLENRQSARAPGFESLSLRHYIYNYFSEMRSFLFTFSKGFESEWLRSNEKCLEWHFESEERRVAARGATESLSLRHYIYKYFSEMRSFYFVYFFKGIRIWTVAKQWKMPQKLKQSKK